MQTTCCQQQHCSGRITTRRLIRRPQYCTSIAHRCHSAATIDQNIILHQTMRQISTLTIKQFLNIPWGWSLDVQRKYDEIDQSGKCSQKNCSIWSIYESHQKYYVQISVFFLYRPINVVFYVWHFKDSLSYTTQNQNV